MALSYKESMEALSKEIAKADEEIEKYEEELEAIEEYKEYQEEHPENSEDSDIEMLASDDDGGSYSYVTNMGYARYSDYEDTDYSTVDYNTKKVTLDPEQVNITQEQNSQYIPFEIPRYYDGIDLSQMTIQIHYVNKDGGSDVSTAVNVMRNNDRIRFGWLVDGNVTAVTGEVQFEITATGATDAGTYVWKSLHNAPINVLESLSYDGLITPSDDWYEVFVKTATELVEEAVAAANEATAAAETASDLAKELSDKIDTVTDDITEDVLKSVSDTLSDYYTKEEVDDIIANLDLSEIYDMIKNIDGLAKFNVTYDASTQTLTFYNGDTVMNIIVLDTTPSPEWQEAFMAQITSEINIVQADLDSYKATVDADLQSIHDAIDGLPETLQSNYYTKEDIDALLSGKASTEDIQTINNSITIINQSLSGVESDINEINTDLANLQDQINNIGDITIYEYEATYEDNIFTLWENGDIKNQFTITGGSGGTENSVITIERITDESSVILADDTAIIEFTFSSVDNTGDSTGDATASWRVGSTTVATQTITQGYNSFDITPYLKTGSNTIRLTVTDSFGSVSAKTWTITVVEFKIESSFDDSLFYSEDVTVRYTPYGDISKDVIFVLDGKQIGSVTTTVTGRQLTYTIQQQSHGSHLLEIYMVATINNQEVRSASVYKDIIWIDSESTTPVIGCAFQDTTMLQYNTINIPYTVYDPQNNPATITLLVNGEVVNTLTVDRVQQTWSYKPTEYGTMTLTIQCRDVTKTIVVTVEELDIDAKPVTTNLALDFNPAGYSNSSSDRIWTDGTTTMSVSSDFDWDNGGYQLDDDGDTYFCVKAGTEASFNYKLFEDDAKRNGKEFKFIFKATNVRNYDGAVLRCMANGIGFEINAQNATLYSEQNSVTTSFREDNYIELEFMILPDSEYTEMLLWTDGIPLEIIPYSASDNFTQTQTADITIGSDDCDVWVYRMKAYTMSLTDDEMLDNFICDAKNADEMVDRYTRNQIIDASGELDPDYLAEACPQLRVIKISCPIFTTGKKDKISNTTVQHIYKAGREVDNWTATGAHVGQGTTSDQYGESGRNIDIDLDSFTFDDGTTGTSYAMTENSVPVSYFNIKVNIASSENANNALLVDDYNEFNPYTRDAKAADPRVRDTMEFHPCVVFLQETDTTNANEFFDGQYHFYACGDFGNSKKNSAVFGMDEDNHKEVIVEVDNNTDLQTRFLSDDLSDEEWDGDQHFEFRYSNFQTDSDEQAAKDAWQTLLTWVVNATPSEFVSGFEDHFVKDSLLYFYLYTERNTMVDSRAKNTFFHTTDLVHWDCCMDYDNDTALGNNNTGGLTLTYGYEDSDELADGYVFNAHDSKLWCYIRDNFQDDLATLFQRLESDLTWSATRKISKFEEYQQMKPERLWIADMRRKYLRPYEDNGTTFYLEMMHGDKKHQRRQFEYYQEKYMASKYVSSTCVSDAITIRGYTPNSWAGVTPSGDLDITPYADTYIVVRYGSYSTEKIRGKRGNTYHVDCPIESMNDTEVYPYNASMLSSIGSIAGFYARVADFGAAIKHTSILIGSNASGYSNSNMTSFSVGSNTILEHLNLQNLPNLAQEVDLSGCVNLIDFYADGSGITGVIFATGGKIEIAHLPASIASITAKNLNSLTDFYIEGYSNISTLHIESCSSIDELDLVQKCTNLTRVRLTGINWTLDDTDLLDWLLTLSGIDDNGYNTTTSVLAGKVTVPVVYERKYADYQEAWPDLDIEYSTMINQFTVTFVNDDENETVLDVQYVNAGEAPVDPVTRADNPIPVPTKESTVSTVYTYAGWDQQLTSIFGNTVIKAVYTEAVREYTVRYLNKGEVLYSTTAPYGTSVFYTGNTPTYTAEETAYGYYLFSGWDLSPYVTGDKDINAEYDYFRYTAGYYDNKSIGELTPVEIYAMMQLNSAVSSFNMEDYVTVKDPIQIQLGHDFSYSDIEENEIISEQTVFNGNNYIDTGITLLDEDRSFIMAMDYTMDAGNSANAVLAQCYQSNGQNGFMLSYSNGPRLTWGSNYTTPASAGNREMLIMRHVKGEYGLHVYTSNISGTEITYTEIDRSRTTEISSTLVFGAQKADDGYIENYARGTIYWAKIWYLDLGDDACRELAAWTHETLPLEMCGFRRYYLSSDSSKRCSMSFLASTLLTHSMPLRSGSYTNSYGWAGTDLCSYLNSRVVAAFPSQWRQLMKQVSVAYFADSEIQYSDDYVFIPGVMEVDATQTDYSAEGTTISYFTNNDSRICCYPDGNAGEWNLRTPRSTSYWFDVNTSGAVFGYSYAANSLGVRIMINI